MNSKKSAQYIMCGIIGGMLLGVVVGVLFFENMNFAIAGGMVLGVITGLALLAFTNNKNN